MECLLFAPRFLDGNQLQTIQHRAFFNVYPFGEAFILWVSTISFGVKPNWSILFILILHFLWYYSEKIALRYTGNATGQNVRQQTTPFLHWQNLKSLVFTLVRTRWEGRCHPPSEIYLGIWKRRFTLWNGNFLQCTCCHGNRKSRATLAKFQLLDTNLQFFQLSKAKLPNLYKLKFYKPPCLILH